MKVVFITPASDLCRMFLYRLGSKVYGQRNSITGPLILGRILKDAGHDVSVYEELYANVDYSKIMDADVYCISTMTSTVPRAYFLADGLHKETKGRVIIGGMHASALPEEAALHANQVVVGEAETVIRNVIEGKITDKIVYAPRLENLDDAPFPDYSLLKTPCSCANVMTTRGCPFCCSFCTTSRMFHPYRGRSVDSVMEELRYYKSIGFKYMNFEDDNFTANKKRAKEICRRMIEEDLVFRETFFFGRTDMANDEELLDLLERAHLTRVLIGIESLNQKSLDTINKHQTVEDIEKCAETLSRHKIRIIASLVLGIDDDGKEDIRKSVDFANKINAYQLQPAILTPFPKTAVYEQYEKENRMMTKDWSLFNMAYVTFIPKKMSPWELQIEIIRVLKRFYAFLPSFKIGKIFGIGYGLRRLGIWLIAKIGIPGVNLIANFAKGTYIYKLKHMTPEEIMKSENIGTPATKS
ncbi:B12-binding domain-containing radical SAM protein [Tepidanaerobacter syntrophicus]|uniref:B12-binding domain-containing radical SAM protein n=1 Tax=Tepidanaerobacter syntrophicus TaxID=224999 RepID=UPI001BD4E9C2|nr:radical SAM protein [Tepidanaerobacter syntrophicus]